MCDRKHKATKENAKIPQIKIQDLRLLSSLMTWVRHVREESAGLQFRHHRTRFLVSAIRLASLKTLAALCSLFPPNLDTVPTKSPTMKLSFPSFFLFTLASQAVASSDKQEFEKTQRKLATAYGTNFFVESKDTEYNAYQTAWRYLGHIVKCGYPSDRYDASENSKSHDSREGYTMGNNYCQRFLLWAAVSR